ncbi:ABC transporter permease [Microbacterium trichothecenolyticum]|uniref:NitT/TauT family transport system permease protein n=1 Tax=Microbacterium trichothecenolyticum TaxID=69370 RepID=A0ABU0TXV9_MICTR|nr:ABC transporter permease [Microbacterium trichothecenolyticum]MDQ1124491.1 NitT/TauT family transport system permease protein [Microbacterium trichothecenolyticum]
MTGVMERPRMRSAASGRAWSLAWPPLLFVAFALVLWEAAVIVLKVPPYVLATPSQIAGEMISAAPLLLQAAWITTQEVLWGFLISVVVGMLIALVVVRFRWLDRAVYPLIVLFQVVPKVALAPIFILWFGYTLTPKLVLIVVMAFFPITLNMVLGLRRIDEDQLLLMRSVGSTRNQILFQVQVPTSLPYLFAGARIAITLAVIGAVVAEFAGAQNGLGYLIQFSATQLDTPRMFAALILVSLLGLAFYYLIALAEFVVARRFPHISHTAD